MAPSSLVATAGAAAASVTSASGREGAPGFAVSSRWSNGPARSNGPRSEDSSVTSAVCAEERGPISSRTRRILSAERPARTTSAPGAEAATADAAPTPEPAPITMTSRPVKENIKGPSNRLSGRPLPPDRPPLPPFCPGRRVWSSTHIFVPAPRAPRGLGPGAPARSHPSLRADRRWDANRGLFSFIPDITPVPRAHAGSYPPAAGPGAGGIPPGTRARVCTYLSVPIVPGTMSWCEAARRGRAGLPGGAVCPRPRRRSGAPPPAARTSGLWRSCGPGA
jgi:hypothetical protein